MSAHAATIAPPLALPRPTVAADGGPFDPGATIPSVTRYRKKRTVSLDEGALCAIMERRQHVTALEQRRTVTIESIEGQDGPDPELTRQPAASTTDTALEDLYAAWHVRSMNGVLGVRKCAWWSPGPHAAPLPPPFRCIHFCMRRSASRPRGSGSSPGLARWRPTIPRRPLPRPRLVGAGATATTPRRRGGPGRATCQTRPLPPGHVERTRFTWRNVNLM